MRYILVIAFSLFSSVNFAADYTVNSVETLQEVLSKVVAGDNIIWKNGTYANVKVNFKPKEKGVSDKRIFLKAETPGKVIFTGSSQMGISGEYLQVEGFTFQGTSTLQDGENVVTFCDLYKADHKSKYCRFTNCSFINYTLELDETENKWVMFYGSYNEIDHCSMVGKKNQGATVVVNYYKAKDYVDGSETAPSTFHHMHHNLFGFRTMPADNGGEQIRVGDSKTSFTKGFNVIEYNYFTDEREEPEVISNKSCDNIYRFNTFMANDGALVLRHGNRCIVYGNYFNGNEGRGKSGGIRIIGDNHTVFNNYLENLEGGKTALKSPFTIMSGVKGTTLNGYYPANDAVVCYNTIVNSVGPIFRIGVGNKGAEYNVPGNLVMFGNLVVDPKGASSLAILEDRIAGYKVNKNNYYTNGDAVSVKGFDAIREKFIKEKDKLKYLIAEKESNEMVKLVNEKLAIHSIVLTDDAVMHFNPEWILKKKDVGVSW